MSSADKKRELIDQIAPFFKNSATAAFETMVFMPIEIGETVDKADGQPEGGISGTVSMAGTVSVSGGDFCGNLSLIFPKAMAESIFRAMMMMGDDDPVEPAEVSDVVGELANMVAGGAKAEMQDQGIDFKIGIPTVVVGDNHHIEPSKDAVSTVTKVTSEKGSFYLELSL
jgi:chemotaxis protein CheX